MKVKDLILELSKYDPETIVLWKENYPEINIVQVCLDSLEDDYKYLVEKLSNEKPWLGLDSQRSYPVLTNSWHCSD